MHIIVKMVDMGWYYLFQFSLQQEHQQILVQVAILSQYELELYCIENNKPISIQLVVHVVFRLYSLYASDVIPNLHVLAPKLTSNTI